LRTMGGIIQRFIPLLALGEFNVPPILMEYLFQHANIFHRALTGVPIAGEILHRCNGEYWGLIAFAGCAYAAGIVCFSVTMWLRRKGVKN
jgi:hypothetical protein